MIRFLAFLLLWVASAQLSAAEPAQFPNSNQGPSPQGEYRERSLIREAFQSQFNEDQLSQFKGPPTIEQLARGMTPDQRRGARAKLGEFESIAKTPEDLEQIARGYLMLDERESAAGQNAVRIAETIRELEPKKAAGFTLAASGLHQMGDYPAATAWAKMALERDPDDKAARAVYMLSVGRMKRTRPGPAGLEASEPPQGAGMTSEPELEIPEKDASPQALSLMRQAVAARRVGDIETTRRLARAAMNADPAASGVQNFFNLVEVDYRKHADTKEYLRLSKEALDGGRGAEAVEWARKAAERSGHPTVYKILELTKQKSEGLAKSSDKSGTTKAPAKDGPPLWPVGVGLGLLGIGYGVYRGNKRTYSSEEGLNPIPEVSREQARANHLKAAAFAGTLLVGLVAWEFGPGVLAAARTLLATAGPGGPGMTPAIAGAGVAGGASVGAISLGESAVGAAKAGVLIGGAAVGARVLSETGSELPIQSFAKGNDAKEHPHGIYEDSPKHGSSARGGPHGKISKTPQNPQEVLDDSMQIKETSKRRVGIDYKNGEFNIFSETGSRKWHGFAMKWEELSLEARNALIRAGKVTRRGRIIKP